MFYNGNVKCWPDNNKFFQEGISYLLRSDNCYLPKGNYLFVDFQMTNLMKLMDFDYYIKESSFFNIILVTDKQMLPVARYLRQCSSMNIVSVINTTTPADEVISKIISDIENPVMRERNFFNVNDLEFIRHCLCGGSMPQLSKITGENIKTLYGRRSRLLKIMGIKSIGAFLLKN